MLNTRSIIESKPFERFIVTIIGINAITLGLETIPGWSDQSLKLLYSVDRVFLAIFTIEQILKIFVYRGRFFKDPWRVFDFIIVGVSLLPSSGPFAVLRALRVLRTLRIISVTPALRKVINGLAVAIPGIVAVSSILCLVFYVGAVMATKLFGNEFPEWFGSLSASAYSLFQIMTLESWSMGIVRPVMDKFAYSWVFFIPFILITTFIMLNLFIAVIVNAMHAETDEAAEERALKGHDDRIQMLAEIRGLAERIEQLKKLVEKK